MPHHTSLRCLAVCAVFLTLHAAGHHAFSAETMPPPNIVVILSDDMGYSDIGCFGGEIRTPNLDKLAGGGLRFTQFYNTARCCPTRASILTGLYPHQAGMGHMTEDKVSPGYRGELNDRCVTIAQALKPAGYGTYAVGKWHVVNGKNIKPDGDKNAWPRQRGFDRFYGTITGAGDFYDPGTLTRDNTMISPMADPEYKPASYYYTDAITDHAVRFISEHHKAAPDKPLFLYTAFTCAHWPMHAPDDEIAKYKGKYDGGYEPIRKARIEKMKQLGLIDPKWDISPMVGDWAKVEDKAWEARCMEVYAAMIDRMDQGIGRIVESLRAAGRLDNTLILYLQDNGGCQETIGRQAKPTNATPFPPIAADAIRLDVIPKQTRDGRPVRQGVGVMPGATDTYIAYGEAWANVSNTPFRMYKHFVHEGGISTPLIAYWPAGIQRKGELERQPGHLIDVMATCVDVSGAAYPKEVAGKPITPLEGRSLAPAFSGKQIERQAIYWEHEGNRAMRLGKWKLVAKGREGKWELYDTEADRTEMHDLAEEQGQRVIAMAEKWHDWAERANVIPWPVEPAKVKANPKRSFSLNASDDLKGEAAPDVANRPLTITAEILEGSQDGVLLAQGGAGVGYALYVQEGRAKFVVRQNGKPVIAATKEPLPANRPMVLKATVIADGTMTLYVDEKVAATARAQGPLPRTPTDGLQVGRDDVAAVGEYKAPFPFAGKLGKVTLELGERTGN